MAFYWQIKTFSTKEEMNKWLEQYQGQIRYVEIFVNNGYAVEWKSLTIY